MSRRLGGVYPRRRQSTRSSLDVEVTYATARYTISANEHDHEAQLFSERIQDVTESFLVVPLNYFALRKRNDRLELISSDRFILLRPRMFSAENDVNSLSLTCARISRCEEKGVN